MGTAGSRGPKSGLFNDARDKQTDERMNGRTDGQTDERTSVTERSDQKR